MSENTAISSPPTKTYTVDINDRTYNVVSYFEGTQTASKLLCDMAVSRILYEPPDSSNRYLQ